MIATIVDCKGSATKRSLRTFRRRKPHGMNIIAKNNYEEAGFLEGEGVRKSTNEHVCSNPSQEPYPESTLKETGRRRRADK